MLQLSVVLTKGQAMAHLKACLLPTLSGIEKRRCFCRGFTLGMAEGESAEGLGGRSSVNAMGSAAQQMS